ncbi:MAG TPA: hypothetical protein DCL21_03670 [Alphaproteobacteria bacterium]|nr:hypothetical protein [Alphaproteobacteria bacterium]
MSKKISALLLASICVFNVVGCSAVDSCLQESYGVSQDQMDNMLDSYIEEQREYLEANGIDVDSMPVHYGECGQR